jgi:hypothetical protein
VKRLVDEWGEESFPASDPPTGWMGPEEYVPPSEAEAQQDEQPPTDGQRRGERPAD